MGSEKTGVRVPPRSTKIIDMKKILLILIIFGSITLLSSFTYKTIRSYATPVLSLKENTVNILKIDTPTVKVKINRKSHNDFLNAIGHQESGNRYNIVNRYGYMGRYQFGKSTLKTLKIKVSKREFLKDSALQEQAMLKLLLHNKKRLQKYIDKYEGRVVHGILVTESGLLAAAHLGGQGSVKKWFRNGRVRKDGNGVKITSYMIRFGGYNLNLPGV